MTFNVNIDLGYEFEVKASADTVFDLLSDVPASASYFPKLDKLVDLGDQRYRWEMARIALAQIELQTIYACRYACDRAQGMVSWTPVPDEGNARVSGHWKIRDKKTSTQLELQVRGELSMALPGLMKMVVAPVAQAKFEKLLDQYIANLIQQFGGEA